MDRLILDVITGTYQENYDAGTKHLLSLSFRVTTQQSIAGAGATVTLLIDLDDFLGYSQEGKDGWITYWVDVKLNFAFSVYWSGSPPADLPFNIGIITHEREGQIDDPLRKLNFTALSLTTGNSSAIHIKVGDVGYGGIDMFSVTAAEPSDAMIDGEFLTTSASVVKGEIRFGELQGVIGEALAVESGGVAWSRFAQTVITSVVAPVGLTNYFNNFVSPTEHRPLTSSDNPPSPDTGNPLQRTIVRVRGGLDGDGDGFADNYIPPSGAGATPSSYSNATVSLFSDNTQQDDFRVEVDDVPFGWRVVSRGANDEQVGDYYNILNAEPSGLFGTLWYIGCTPSAVETAAIEFRLLEDGFPFWGDAIDTVTAAFSCAYPPELPENEVELTVRKIGGSLDGSVSGTGLLCNEDCVEKAKSYTSGSMISLMAVANAGTTFSGWGGDCSGSGSCQVTMDRDREITASFNPVSISTSPPDGPTGLSATAISTSQIHLTWADQGTGEDGYKVERKNPGGDWFQIKSLAANATSFTNTSLTPDSTYSYRVYAYNEGGTSAYSNQISATTFSDAPNTPSGLQGWALSNTKVALNWQDTNNGSASFEIEMSTNGGASWSVVGYNGKGDTSYTRTVSEGSSPSFRVRAYRSGSGYSNYSSVIQLTACAPPDDPRLKDPYSGEDDVEVHRVLEWDGDDDVSSWDLYLGTTDPPTLFASGIGNPSPGDDILYDPGALAVGTTYYWQVLARAACDPLLTSASPVNFFTTLGSPDAVTLLRPVDGAVDQPTGVVLDWANVQSDGGTHYDLYLGKTSPPVFEEAMETRTEKLVQLDSNSTYYWRVVAKSTEDPSLTNTSPTWSFTTGIGQVDTITLEAVADAGLRAGGFANTNYGGDPGGAAEQKVFGLGNDDSFYLSPGLEALRGALRFDLSSIPSGAEITNATLTMQFAGSSGSQSAPLPLFFSPYQASWSEDSITWNNRPSVDGAHQVEGSFPLSGFNPTQNDVTALATKWEDGTLANNGVEVSIPSWETANYKAKYFYQKEWAADRVATLQVTYLKPCTATLPPSVPTPVDTATGLDSPVNLGWAAVTGASGYEIYLGTSPGSLSPLSLTPHPFAVLSGLQPTTTFYWRVDSIAACDASLKTSSPTWSFTTSTCVDPQPPQVSNPAPGSTGLGSQVTLSWTSVPGTSFYEVYLWKSNEPEALLRSVNGLSTVAVVDSASTYAWKVVAVPACDPNLSASSSVETFTTASGPVAHVGSDSKVAVGGSVQLGDTPAASGGSPGYSYQWSVVPTGSASLSSASTPNPVLTGLAPGNVVCTLTVTDSNGFQSVPVQVNVLVEEPLFLDGFESGDLNAWSSFTSGL